MDSSTSDQSDDDDSLIRMLEPVEVSTTESVKLIWADLQRNYYMSIDWSDEFYINCAYHGFISVAQPAPSPKYLPLLVPEIQKEYCILDFGELHVGRNVRKRVRQGQYQLGINTDIKAVIAGIDAKHERSWLIPEYCTILLALQEAGTVGIPASAGRSVIQVISVELRDQDDVLAAGELGYIIGSTYTSLSGFFNESSVSRSAAANNRSIDEVASPPGTPNSEKKLRFDSAGKIQLVALGKLLQRNGVHFWNLGHPPRPPNGKKKAMMMYKAEIGGKVLSREAFLKRWCEARDSPLPAAFSKACHCATELIASGR